MKQIPGASKQAISVALKELEEYSLLTKTIVKLKPLHIQYEISETGKAIIPLLKQLEGLS